MTPEAIDMAKRAWVAMLRNPSILDTFAGAQAMPPAIALDMVQDVTGDRAEAMRTLFEVAANSLVSARPKEPTTIESLAVDLIALLIRFAQLRNVRSHFGTIDRATNFPDPRGEGLLRLESYRLWAIEARRVLTICEALAEAV